MYLDGWVSADLQQNPDIFWARPIHLRWGPVFPPKLLPWGGRHTHLEGDLQVNRLPTCFNVGLTKVPGTRILGASALEPESRLSTAVGLLRGFCGRGRTTVRLRPAGRLLGCSETASLVGRAKLTPQIQGPESPEALWELRNRRFQRAGPPRCEPVGILGTPLVPQPCQAGIWPCSPGIPGLQMGPVGLPRVPWWGSAHLSPAFPGSGQLCLLPNASALCLASVQAFRDAL